MLGFYCSACGWSRDIIVGKSGELSEERAKEQFEQHVCAGSEDVNQTAARIVREAAKD